MQLSSIFIMTTLVVAVVGFPSKEAVKTASETRQLLQKLGIDSEGPVVQEEMGRACSKQKGESCKHNCQCCGATVICGTIWVGGKEVNQCMDKTSNNAALNTLGQGLNALENAASAWVCWGK